MSENYGYNKLFRQLYVAHHSRKRYIVNQGGARSGKTTATLQLLYHIAKTSRKPLVISVVSESLPHLRLGAIRDFTNILRNEGLIPEKIVNLTTNTYKVGKSIIEFFSADNPSKVHGPSRDILFLNEAINISYQIADHLFIRTSGAIFIDYNPVSEFWVHEHILNLPETAYFQTTYLDNLFVPEWIRKDIENHRNNENWWKVYGLGEIGSREGLVFDNWKQSDTFPENTDVVWYGLDFGFTNDPSSLVKVCKQSGELWVNELFYETGLINKDISDRMELLGVRKGIDEIIADSAEPKSIAELRQRGWLIRGVTKGPDSVRKGIDTIKEYQVNVTKDSVNLIKEFRNYKWEIDKFTGKSLNVPIDAFNHGLDAFRYIAMMKIARPEFGMEQEN